MMLAMIGACLSLLLLSRVHDRQMAGLQGRKAAGR